LTECLREKDSISYSQELSAFYKGGIINVEKRSTEPKICELMQTNGLKATVAELVLYIHDLISYYNIDNTLRADQVTNLAIQLIEEYENYRMVDFAICFNNAKKSKYGKVFNRLDGAVIMEFMRQYEEELESDIDTFDRNRKADQGESFNYGGGAIERLSPVNGNRLGDLFKNFNLRKK